MKTTENLHDLTVAKIGQLVGDFTRQRREITEELAAIFAATSAGAPEPPPATERDEAVRNRVLFLLNGYSPENLKLPPALPRRQELEVEVQAIDVVLAALSAKELAARAAEAADFILVHGAEWDAICRDIILTATRLRVLEERAAHFRAALRGHEPAAMPLAAFIGTGRSIVGVAWAHDPLSRPREAALTAGIVTKSDLMGAENA